MAGLKWRGADPQEEGAAVQICRTGSGWPACCGVLPDLAWSGSGAAVAVVVAPCCQGEEEQLQVDSGGGGGRPWMQVGVCGCEGGRPWLLVPCWLRPRKGAAM